MDDTGKPAMTQHDAIFYGLLAIGSGFWAVAAALFWMSGAIVKSRQITNIYPDRKGPKSIAEMSPQERAEFEKQKEAIIREARARLDRRKQEQAESGTNFSATNTRPPRYVVDRTRG